LDNDNCVNVPKCAQLTDNEACMKVLLTVFAI